MIAANIVGGILFSGIGFVALMYGKKQGNLKAIIIGVLLLTYSYFVQNTIALYIIGAGLTLALFIPR